MRAPRNPKVNRDIVLDLPDCADEGGAASEHADIAFIKEFGDRSNWPVMRTLDDAVEKVIGMLLAGELDLRVQVDGAPVPALRNDAVEDCSGPMLIIDPRQENAELGCDTGPGLLLQRPLAQYAFEESLAFNQACTGDSCGQTMRELTLECCLPTRNEAVIDPEIGSEQRALGSGAKVFDRAELEFHLARFHDGRIGAVEWTIS